MANRTFLDRVILPASIAGEAPINIPHGTAPSSPADGDMWNTSAGWFFRINGVTYPLPLSFSTLAKFAQDVGDGASVSIGVTHSLGSKDVVVSVHDNTAPFAEVLCGVEKTSTSAITLTFSVAPTSAQYRVTVIG